MQILEEKRNDIYIIKPDGPLNSNTYPKFEKILTRAIEDRFKYMIIDFERVEYISSAGLRVILGVTRDIKRRDGKLVLCSMSDSIREVFKMAEFDSFLLIVPTVEDALNQL